MTVAIDHDERGRRILERALELFSDRGYAGVTYQSIADRCGIARTAIYRYFENKRQIFDYAIRQFAEGVGEPFAVVMRDRALSAGEKMQRIMRDVIDALCARQTLLKVIAQYLIDLKSSGVDVGRRVRRHTIGLQRILTHLLREGVRHCEFIPVNPRAAGRLFFEVLEATVLGVAVTDTVDRRRVTETVQLIFKGLQPKARAV